MLQCKVLEGQSLCYAWSVIDQSILNVKFLEEGKEQRINNETSAIREHHDITLHKNLRKGSDT